MTYKVGTMKWFSGGKHAFFDFFVFFPFTVDMNLVIISEN